MKSLIPNSTPHQFSHHKPPLIFHSPLKNPIFKRSCPVQKTLVSIFFNIHFTKSNLFSPRTKIDCSCTSADSVSLNGWDDVQLGGESVQTGELTQLRTILGYFGFDDKKYIFVYALGFVCALAISKIRVSTIVVFPAFFLFFAVGFFVGIVNKGNFNDLSFNGGKKRRKDEIFRGLVEKMRSLVELFDGFDVKISNLKNDIRNSLESNLVRRSDLENYVKEIESIGMSALQAKGVVEGYIDTVLVDNQTSSNRTKDVGRTGFDFSGILAGFQEKSAGTKGNKMKENVKKSLKNIEDSQANILALDEDESFSRPLHNDELRNGNVGSRYASNDYIRVQDLAKEKSSPEMKEINSVGRENGENGTKEFLTEEYIFQNNKRQLIENEQFSTNSVKTRASQDGSLDLDFVVSLKHTRSQASFDQEQSFMRINRKNMTSNSMENIGNEPYGFPIGDEQVMTENNPSQTSRRSTLEVEPHSVVSDDMTFNNYLAEASVLLKQAKESLRGRNNEGDAENVLYKSATLLSKAIDMKPMSLLAVGQLGNTYLLHGELKLKISRRLRALLARSEGKIVKGLDDKVARKEKVASYLVAVCEECEDLLVKAGRKYRAALSIDGNDMRALYNWGLALSFRAQLIADIGPEAAFDADKVYMAAIDKFDAMMSKSNVHAPEALFRWGMTLQQRSRLRTRNVKEKVKLLSQAKRLYEDALNMDSNNLQVKEALSSCISEMNNRNY